MGIPEGSGGEGWSSWASARDTHPEGAGGNAVASRANAHWKGNEPAGVFLLVLVSLPEFVRSRWPFFVHHFATTRPND